MPLTLPEDISIEKFILAHRYLYYVEATPVLPDSIYDQYERKARELLPDNKIVNGVGSCLPSSYSEDVKNYARSLVKCR
jgi:NAD-dependent DNA ligase